jgi:diguanylate cyclase (GGDEF)-like protein
VHVSASIGIAVARQDEYTAARLLSRADDALYTAKQAGRNAYFMHAQLEGLAHA